MKTFELNLHWKQGDDLAAHLKRSAPTKALKNWAQDFRRCVEICDQLALAIEGQKIKIEADTHMIMLLPQNQKAEDVLLDLVKKKILSISPGDIDVGD